MTPSEAFVETPIKQEVTEIARYMGAEGQTNSNLGDVGEALEKACDTLKAGKATGLEVEMTQAWGIRSGVTPSSIPSACKSSISTRTSMAKLNVKS